VKDPTYIPPPVYRCSNGELATPCGTSGDKPVPIPMLGRPRSRSVTNGVTKVTRDIMWPAGCDPECTEPGFCMTASCGASATCSATCVKDDNYVVSSRLRV
jgi:hypothetical protein